MQHQLLSFSRNARRWQAGAARLLRSCMVWSVAGYVTRVLFTSEACHEACNLEVSQASTTRKSVIRLRGADGHVLQQRAVAHSRWHVFFACCEHRLHCRTRTVSYRRTRIVRHNASCKRMYHAWPISPARHRRGLFEFDV
jgi:hypothetical protein